MHFISGLEALVKASKLSDRRDSITSEVERLSVGGIDPHGSEDPQISKPLCPCAILDPPKIQKSFV